MSLNFKRGRLTPSQRKFLLKRQRGRCFYCRIKLNHTGNSPDDGNRDPAWATVDHRIAVSSGGLTNLENCVMACWSCNVTKGVADG